MSGGHFDYIQHRITDIIESVEEIIKNNKTNEYYNYKYQTINEFKSGLEFLKIAQIYAQRIDWLVSGDDGEESFHRRLREDLEKIYGNNAT